MRKCGDPALEFAMQDRRPRIDGHGAHAGVAPQEGAPRFGKYRSHPGGSGLAEGSGVVTGQHQGMQEETGSGPNCVEIAQCRHGQVAPQSNRVVGGEAVLLLRELIGGDRPRPPFDPDQFSVRAERFVQLRIAPRKAPEHFLDQGPFNHGPPVRSVSILPPRPRSPRAESRADRRRTRGQPQSPSAP